MKHLMLLSILIGSSLTPYAQKVVDGYYITPQNDSVMAHIRIPKILFGGINIQQLESKVKSADEGKTSYQKFKPKEIKEFGFYFNNRSYQFCSKPVTKRQSMFFQLIYSRNVVRAFFYFKTGAHGSVFREVRLEKPDGQSLTVLGSMTRRKIARRLRAFFTEIPSASTAITKRAISIRRLDQSIRDVLASMPDL